MGRILFIVTILGIVLTCSAQEAPARPVSAYMLDDHLSDALIEAPPAPPYPDSVSFRFAGSAAGWTATAPASLDATDTGIVFSGPGELASPPELNISGREIDSAVVRMKVTGAEVISLAWRPMGDKEAELHRVVRVHVARPGEMATYRVQLSGIRAWRYRQIDHVKLCVNQAASIELESIAFLSRKSVFAERSVGMHGFSIGNKVRPCLFAHTPATLRYKLTVPPKAQFSSGLGIVDAAPATFSLAVKQGEETAVVFEKTVPNNEQWHDVRFDLSQYENRDVELALRVQSEGSGQVGLWSNPVVYGPVSEACAEDDEPEEQGRRHVASEKAASCRCSLNVLVYVVDCLRADHLNAYGYVRETAPNVAAFARSGVQFSRCFSQETWTKPSMGTLLTGTDSHVHGIEAFGDVIPDSLVLLPEILRRNGYATCAISENPHTPPDTNDRRAFSFLETPHLRVELGEHRLKWNELPEVTYQAATDFLEANKDRPFFLYVHTMELHDIVVAPPAEHMVYDPPAAYRGLWSSQDAIEGMDLFDECIRYADANFQRVIDKLAALGLDKNTLVIFMADHGEGFGEHEDKYGHYGKPYNELTHIPLIMRMPGVVPDGRVMKENVGIVDVAPTILDVLGLAVPEQFQGMSLVALMNGSSHAARAVCSTWCGSSSIVKGDWKLFRDVGGTRMLFNLANDSSESCDVAAAHPEVAAELDRLLSTYIEQQRQKGERAKSQNQDATHAIDPAAQQALESLGYLPSEP